MSPKQLAPDLWVSPQVALTDLAAACGRGFRSIIVNRPDGEEPGQPTIEQMRQGASDAGLGFAAIPVVPGQLTDAEVARFAEALQTLDGPVLAYCRTGTRSASLWALSQAQGREPDALLRTAEAAGYDLSALRSRLEQRHAGMAQADGATGATASDASPGFAGQKPEPRES